MASVGAEFTWAQRILVMGCRNLKPEEGDLTTSAVELSTDTTPDDKLWVAVAVINVIAGSRIRLLLQQLELLLTNF